MLLATTESIAGARVRKTLGLVQGTVTRSVHFRSRLSGALRGMLGGEVVEYTKIIAESREQALDRMRTHAADLGANAIVGVRFATAEVANHAAEIVAYGTAVVIETGA
jgi:uncharacterized protein YbjQ (UPF0145 family)